MACYLSPRTGDTLVYINMFSNVYWDSFFNQPLFSILRNALVVIMPDAISGIVFFSFLAIWGAVFLIVCKVGSYSAFLTLGIFMFFIQVFGYEMYWFLLRQNMAVLVMLCFALLGFPVVGVFFAGLIHYAVGGVGVLALLFLFFYKRFQWLGVFLLAFFVFFLVVNIGVASELFGLSVISGYRDFYGSYSVGVGKYYRALIFDFSVFLVAITFWRNKLEKDLVMILMVLLSSILAGFGVLSFSEMAAYRIFSIGKFFALVLVCFFVALESRRYLRF